MTSFARFVCGRPWLIIGLNLALTAYLATGLQFGETRSIFCGELPEDDPIVRDNDEFTAHYPDRNFYVLGVQSDGESGIWNAQTLRKVVEISNEARELDGALPNVQSLATWDVITADGDTITNRPLMREAPELADDIARLRAVAESDPLLRGRLVSDDGRVALIRIGFREGVSPNSIYRAIENLRSRHEGPEQIHVFGREYLNALIDQAVSTHVGVLMPLALVVLHAFYYLCFGRIQAVLLPLFVIVCAEIDYVGVTGLLGIPTSILSSTIPIVLIVTLGSYVEHLMKRAYEEAETLPWREAVEVALSRSGQGIALAWVTTAFGFASLVTFQIYSIREFGVLAAAAVLIGGALSLTLLPSAMVVWSRGVPREHWLARRWYVALVERLTDAAVAAAGPRRWHARALLLAIAGLAAYGVAALRVGSNAPEFFPEGHPFRTGFERLLTHFRGDGFLFVDVSAPPGRTVFDPGFLDRVSAFQRDASAIPGVAWASSLVDRVIMRSHRVMNGDEPAYERVPPSAELASAYTEVFRWNAPETLAEMTEDVDAPTRLVIDIFADVNDSARIAEIVGALDEARRRHFPTEAQGRAIFGGEWVLWVAQTRYIVVGKIANIVTSIPLVALVCLWQLRSLRDSLLSVCPAAFAALAVIGLMGLVGIRLDLASCVITAIVAGVGADFAIHFILRHREVLQGGDPGMSPQSVNERAVRLSAPPIINDSLSNAVAFGVCIASPLVPVREFGWLICLAMLTSAAAALMLLPGLLEGTAAHIRSRTHGTETVEELRSGANALPHAQLLQRRRHDG